MVANLTIGKKAYKKVEGKVMTILDKAQGCMASLKTLTSRDMESWRLPSDTEDEKQGKEKATEEAAKQASDVPIKICKVCLELLTLAKDMAPIGNKTAISDVGVAVYLAEASLRAAMLSVDINMRLIRDELFLEKITTHKGSLLSLSEKLKNDVLGTVRERL